MTTTMTVIGTIARPYHIERIVERWGDNYWVRAGRLCYPVDAIGTPQRPHGSNGYTSGLTLTDDELAELSELIQRDRHTFPVA